LPGVVSVPTEVIQTYRDGMSGEPDIAQVAKLLADPSRAAICLALLDGRFRTAGGLARAAQVTASTASEHLGRLLQGGLVELACQGRHPLLPTSGGEVAAALEALGVLAHPTPVRSLRQATASTRLRAGRTCYDHLAGRLGVALTDALIVTSIITAEFAVTDLTPLDGLDLRLPPGRRPLLRPCLDWTERCYHAAGALPAALTTRLLDLEWIVRVADTRAIRVTDAGRHHLADIFGEHLLDIAA
jgi:DNA-binding transcriptional ArsR family regulator